MRVIRILVSSNVNGDESIIDDVNNSSDVLHNTETLPFTLDNDKNDRTVIDVIKDNMIQERDRVDALFLSLNSQITFLKGEILHKNALINNLMAKLTNSVNSAGIQSNTKLDVDNNYQPIKECLSSVTTDEDSVVRDNRNTDVIEGTDFLRWHAVDDESIVSEMPAQDMNDVRSTSCDYNGRNLVMDEESDFEKLFSNINVCKNTRQQPTATSQPLHKPQGTTTSNHSETKRTNVNIPHLWINNVEEAGDEDFEEIERKKVWLRGKLENVIDVLSAQEVEKQKEAFIVEGNPNENADKSAVSLLEDSQYTYEWQKSSSGFAGKIVEKMGYKKGRGLGKNEDGVFEAIGVVQKTDRTIPSNNKKNEKKLLYIASSSMLNQMDEKRLSRGNIDVKVRFHNGCTVKCMYTHLPEMFAKKPDFVLLHIGSNDCSKKSGKISDDVLEEIRKLVEFIAWNLPCTKVILSLPIVRRDCSVANAVQQNLKTKLKRLLYPYLDHSNIDTSQLGKKGLHLSSSGTRLVARNIISLIKRL